MYSLSNLITQARTHGFTGVAELSRDMLQVMPEIRDMCAADRCHSYGKSWVCPPACGDLEDISQKISRYEKGILVQTTGSMEDEFDFESIQDLEKKHNGHFQSLLPKLREEFPDMLPMSAGKCSICRSCAYPDTPCRFPDKAYPSMEAYGLFVSNVCERAHIPYYHGPLTMTFTSCFLLV